MPPAMERWEPNIREKAYPTGITIYHPSSPHAAYFYRISLVEPHIEVLLAVVVVRGEALLYCLLACPAKHRLSHLRTLGQRHNQSVDGLVRGIAVKSNRPNLFRPTLIGSFEK